MLLKLVFYCYTYFILIDFAWRIDESCRVIVQNEVLRSVRLYSHKVAFALRLCLIVDVPVVVFRHLSDDFLRQSLVIVVSKDLFQCDLPTRFRVNIKAKRILCSGFTRLYRYIRDINHIVFHSRNYPCVDI